MSVLHLVDIKLDVVGVCHRGPTHFFRVDKLRAGTLDLAHAVCNGQ